MNYILLKTLKINYHWITLDLFPPRFSVKVISRHSKWDRRYELPYGPCMFHVAKDCRDGCMMVLLAWPMLKPASNVHFCYSKSWFWTGLVFFQEELKPWKFQIILTQFWVVHYWIICLIKFCLLCNWCKNIILGFWAALLRGNITYEFSSSSGPLWSNND